MALVLIVLVVLGIVFRADVVAAWGKVQEFMGVHGPLRSFLDVSSILLLLFVI